MAQDKRSHIGGLHVGDIVTFFTKGEKRSVTGIVKSLRFPNVAEEGQGGYADVTVLVDSMAYVFGTGGHLGKTWTTENGMEQWFVEVKQDA